MIKCFRGLTLARKLYAVSASALFAGSVLTIVATHKRFSNPVVPLSQLFLASGFMIAAVGVGIEFVPTVWRLRDTTIKKSAYVLFFTISAFIADLIGRQTIYDITGENPDAFTASRVALSVVFMPFAWLIVGAVYAFAGALMSIAPTMLPMFELFIYQFGLRLPPSWLSTRHPWFSRSVGLFVIAFLCCYVFSELTELKKRCRPQADSLLTAVIMRTGFYEVPDGRYTTLSPKSLRYLAFLPGDRVCVAELLENGKANFHTIRRDDLK